MNTSSAAAPSGPAIPDLACAADSGLRPLSASAVALRAAAARASLRCIRVDLAACADKASLLECFARALRFPDWFGHNWDAFDDCLRDLSWLPAQGYVLILEHAPDARARCGEDCAIALDILAEAAAIWRDESVPFWVFYDGCDEAATAASAADAADGEPGGETPQTAAPPPQSGSSK